MRIRTTHAMSVDHLARLRTYRAYLRARAIERVLWGALWGAMLVILAACLIGALASFPLIVSRVR